MSRRNGFLKPWIWIVYAILFVLAVPWYWPVDDERVLLGFPLWVVVTVGISALISCFSAWLFLACWPDEDETEEGVE